MKRFVRYAVALAYAQLPCLAEPTPSNATDTCSSASINIITHGLPQQCLRTNWTSSSPQDKPTTIATSPEASRTLSRKVESVIVSLAAAQTPGTGSSSASDDSTGTEGKASPTPILSASDGAVGASASLASSTTGSASDEGQDSFLDAAKFLSFEDWKKQKLGEAGNSAEALARSRGEPGRQPHRQRPGEGFDTLGEESEISLDFGGFASAIRPSPKAADGNQQPNGPPSENSKQTAPAPHLRSKDAGRTCKERFNYASFDCAATVLKTNSKCKSATSVLVENKDSYMLNECSTDNKFLIVELCEWVEIDTIVLANFEFFSSMFRTFRVSVSDRYPVKLDKWRVLGTFEARNTREIQAFLVESPMLWAKFLRIEFLTHYGNEFYCPLSLLRVHGTNMMEDFRRTNENDSQDEVEEAEIAVVPIVPSPQTGSELAEALPDATPQPIDVEIVSVKPEKPHSQSDSMESTQTCAKARTPLTQGGELCAATYSSVNDAPSSGVPTSSSFAFTQDTGNLTTSLQSTSVESPSTTASIPTPSPSLVASVSSTPAATDSASPTSTLRPVVLETTGPSTPTASSNVSSTSENGSVASHAPPAVLLNTTSSDDGPKPTSLQSTQQQESPKSSSTSSSSGSSTSSTQLAQAPQIAASVAIAKEQSPSPHPPTQESIFKSITRRLSLLEANATLSLQYIESQSALLRSAFAATSAQQLNRTSTFLDKLDATVLGELARAKADYEQLWQSTVLELHGQREEGRKEREILGERVRLLAEEVVGTKRLMAAQATLLLIVLGLVIFTRNAPLPHNDTSGSSVDLRYLSSSVRGLIRHGRSRSNLKSSEEARSTSRHRRRWQWDGMSPWASPPQTRPGTSASGDGNRDRLGRRSSDEASQEHVVANNEQGHRAEKPLPPAPRRDEDDEQDQSDSASERRDTVTLRNYRPNLRALRINMANETSDSPNGYYGTTSAADGEVDHTDMTNGNGIHAALLRDAQSAPTTPSVESSSLSAYQAEHPAAEPLPKG